jgi:serine-type D-Ala-D-Ala carboxypeptidase/endopeptidase (penicillin-binding protein 4)
MNWREAGGPGPLREPLPLRAEIRFLLDARLRIERISQVRTLLLLVPLTTLLLSSSPAAAQLSTAERRAAALTLHIDQSLSVAPHNRAIWGIRVEEADGTVLYSLNADRLMIPASNRKLFTAAFAHHCFGFTGQLTTEVWIDGEIEGDTLRGHLILVGGGDPSLGGRFEANREEVFLPVLSALRSRGIRQIGGSVIGDASLFDRDTIPGSWKNDNLGETYAAPVDALAWNENVVGLGLTSRGCEVTSNFTDPSFVPMRLALNCDYPHRVELTTAVNNEAIAVGNLGPAGRRTNRRLRSIPSPALYAAQALSAFLEGNGITIAHPPAEHFEPAQWGARLATIESPPIVDHLALILEVSQNLYAEMLLKASAATAAPVSYAAALAAESDFLVQVVGIPADSFSFRDGSGLSPDDVVTPNALIAIVRYLNRPEHQGGFWQITARPGGVGTLRNRLPGLSERVRAKTGTINRVAGLSGVVIGSDQRLRYFSIVVNHHDGTESQVRQAIDGIVVRLSEL